MPTFEAHMRAVHVEIWTVEAKDETEARRLISDFDESVVEDDSGGDVVDWEISKITKVG